MSSASVSTTRGLLERETRYEGTLGASHQADTTHGPLELLGFARVSIEPDYRSGRLRANWELEATGTTLSALAGYGHDVSEPATAPPGGAGRWPATNQRVQGGLTLTQVVNRRTVASGGVVVSHQFGVLESPYRRARVVSSLESKLRRQREVHMLRIGAQAYRGVRLEHPLEGPTTDTKPEGHSHE